MRLEVVCQDRIGLTHELLDLLVKRSIDLQGIEISSACCLYLNFAAIPFSVFSQLMAEIRLISGVSDVRTVDYLPSERNQYIAQAIAEGVSDPLWILDARGRIIQSNLAARTQLPSRDPLQFTPELIAIGSSIARWLEKEPEESLLQPVTIRQRSYLVEVKPVRRPVDNADSDNIVAAVMILKPAHRSGHLSSAAEQHSAFELVIDHSPKMQQVVSEAKKLAKLEAPLLITGETGTGKEMMAYACHQASPRAGGKFLALNCASLPDNVAESELFGHAAGAYPNALQNKKGFFEQANGGSVLLDEIGEMSSQMQTKLLRFLNDGTFRRVGEDHEVKVDVRIICTTQKNLTDLVQQGLFRKDLFYRLNVLTLHLPSLRERQLDILPLSELFIAQFAEQQNSPCPGLSSEVNHILTRYSWPGNVRQLRNVLYHSLAQSSGAKLESQHIILPDYRDETHFEEEPVNGTLDEIMGRYERSLLTRLWLNYPSTRKLAKRLGVSHTAIANKLREYGLNKKKSDGENR